MINILVISVEGEKSNSEVNFYTGLSHWLENVAVFAIGKEGASSSNQKTKKIIKNLKLAIQSSSKTFNKELIVFFIGDGDQVGEIPAMERASKTAYDELIETWSHKILNGHTFLYDEGARFETVMMKLDKKKVIKGWKDKKHNSWKDIFNYFAEIFGWFDGPKLNKTKILSDLKQLNTYHYEVFKAILD